MTLNQHRIIISRLFSSNSNCNSSKKRSQNNSYSSSISNRDNEGSSSNLKTIYTLLDENTRFVKNYGGEEITSIEDE